VVSVAPELWNGTEFVGMVIWILVSMLIALTLPNTLQILSRYEPALGVKPQTADIKGRGISEWNTSLPWAIGVSIVAAIGIISLSGPSEFLYWQF